MTRAEPLFLFDSNSCIYLINGTSLTLAARVEACDEGSIVTSAIAYAEVMIGARRQEVVEQASRLFGIIRPLPFDDAAAISYTSLPFRRGSFDRLIAAHAVSLGLTLVTNNECDFADIPGLRVENWTR
ncbi:tRNA(fMet)-specific endonuclease VapC [Sphingomonas jinjuensis]|uniref:Ribonuclease VapC n=1 Tax=Sphingomonas jinjuensis TaxID=535907 RepID=A0A840F4Z6_9SPHN|nr:tRNA(fMet)-specific endonuclease VapC [Sphingomonas jinjuensis]